MRKNSFAIIGGQFGDEGKGKIVDEICAALSRKHEKIIVYRWNGGANAGHTVIIGGQKIVLHNIPSGALTKGAIAILGKGMVIHPMDLLKELMDVTEKFGFPKNLIIDEMATLSLDTHRAFESALKEREEGGAGSTGRGIAPAYADIVLRHPVRMRDLVSENWEVILTKHYDLYASFTKGLGKDISEILVPTVSGQAKKMGSKETFLDQLMFARNLLLPFIKNVDGLLKENWIGTTPFVFEGAQGVGLDPRWGVYPDVTASETTFSGIHSSTEGLIDPVNIEYKIAVYKATYMSSVGKRVLPSKMKETLAEKIRKDANEFGATTGRPRDIYHIDIPALSYFKSVSRVTHMALTHLDVSYKSVPVALCVAYKVGGGEYVPYRPDQKYLDKVKPVYKSFQSWEGKNMRGATKFINLPKPAREYVKSLAKLLGLKTFMISTGPERNSLITFSPR